ncbi:MAG: CPBP family intramembrane metalloprotease [Candidatus Latescibacteria bacterium]|nr:CPBP family intramembrane metalloprotease [Candidatus Latescibacterota bacterium]
MTNLDSVRWQCSWNAKTVIKIWFIAFILNTIFSYFLFLFAKRLDIHLPDGLDILTWNTSLFLFTIFFLWRKSGLLFVQEMGLNKSGPIRNILFGILLAFGLSQILKFVLNIFSDATTYKAIGLALFKIEFGSLAVIFTFVAALTEEITVRGLVHTYLRSRLGPLVCCSISIFIFLLMHTYTLLQFDGSMFVIRLIWFTATGTLFVLLYERTRSVIPGTIAHLVINGVVLFGVVPIPKT